jgi:DNA modification methylase
MTDRLTILVGDWIEQLRTLPDESVQCCVTSPPYWGLRDYGVDGQLGLEKNPDEYVSKIVEGFREVRRVLRNDGTLWLNLGDSYAGSWGAQSRSNGSLEKCTLESPSKKLLSARQIQAHPKETGTGSLKNTPGCKAKDLVGIPWMVAFALRADGWYLRCDIIWAKPNPMPESVTDRPTKAHEYIFLLTKSERYFYDHEAIKEGASPGTHERLSQATLQKQNGGSKQEAYRENTDVGKKSRDRTPAEILKAMGRKMAEAGSGIKNNSSMNEALAVMPLTRNSRSVWTLTTEPFKGAHFATFPSEIPRRAILAGTSSHGSCADCGAPWERVTVRVPGTPASWNVGKRPVIGGKSAEAEKHNGHKRMAETRELMRQQTGKHDNYFPPTATLRWQPTCECHGKIVRKKVIIPARLNKEQVSEWGADSNGEYLGLSTKGHADHGVQDASAIKARIIENATKDREVMADIYESELPLEKHSVTPCVVLDPFGGSGTTGEVALALGRKVVLCELNPDYVKLIEQRCYNTTPGLALPL